MQSHEEPASTDTKAPPSRLVSLDALRGADMFFLVAFSSVLGTLPILSDNSVFQFLAEQCHHPKWHGYTAWDQIFPLFIFIMGVAMPFSFAKRLERGDKKTLYKHVAIRAVVLFLLGIVYWGNPPGSENYGWGLYSVLYRIGFCYFVATLIVLNFKVRGQAIWAGSLVLGYCLAMHFIPVPDYGAGDYSQEGNLVAFVTGWYESFLPSITKHLLSITLIPSVANALLGALVGQWLRSEKSPNEKTRGLLVAGLLFIAFGLLLQLSIPICKKMLTTSFTFLTCGISMSLLGLFYWVIDVKGYRKWAFFFVVVGMNSITIYIAVRYIDFTKLAIVFTGIFGDMLGSAGSLAIAVTSATLKWGLLYFLFRHKVFLKV